jgi:hypothetical protein
MVEFALVGGLFFFLVFSLVNAGFFLNGRDAVEHAADAGVAALSEEGSCSVTGGICLAITSNCPNYDGGHMASTADELAICEMNESGLVSAPLIHVTAIDIYKVLQSDGAPVDTCGSNGTGAGTSPCNAPVGCVVGTTCLEDAYSVDGVNGPVDNWLDSSRNVSPASADFVRLVVQFNYSLIATSGSISMSTSNVFRLEPQQ